MFKRFLMVLTAVMLLPLYAFAAQTPVARELDVALFDNRTQLDQASMRDGRDDTSYTPKRNKTFTLTGELQEGESLSQVYMRLNAMPKTVEIVTQADGKRWSAVATLTSPGPEFMITVPTPVTGKFRLNVTFDKNTALSICECRLFEQGSMNAAIHQWEAAGEADALLILDDLAEADMPAIASWTATGRSVTVCALAQPEGDILSLTDALWDAGVRTMPQFGGFRAVEGDGAARLKTWHEVNVVKKITSWIRLVQPQLLITGQGVVASTYASACENARKYTYEVDDAAANGLWIVPESCTAEDDIPARLSALSDRDYTALREMCAQGFASAVHGDPAAIPYPANRLEDGYLPEGEFLHEDEENGLWAYLSATVQVEIIRYEQPEIPRVWFETEVKFKPEAEKFQQVLYANASFPDQQIYPETLAQASQMVLAINGDYYPYRLDRKQAAGNILRDYTVLHDFVDKRVRSFPNLDTVAFKDDGTLEVYAVRETTATALAAQGDVHDALSFGPYLARDGKLRIYSGESWNANEPRTAIGMIGAGHYHILTVEGRMPKGGPAGLNINDLAMLMYARGVSDAMNLDGGSTSVLIFMGNKLNRTGKGTSVGSPRNQHELFGVGTSSLVYTDMLNKR